MFVDVGWRGIVTNRCEGWSGWRRAMVRVIFVLLSCLTENAPDRRARDRRCIAKMNYEIWESDGT